MRLVFGDFTLDRTTRQLLRGGEPRHLEPKAFELLDLLVGRRPAAVTKAEIRDRLWPDTFVSESNLTGLVAPFAWAVYC
jgi:DNA-binding winged helix-turn-helix (wHTH) protein